MAAAPMLSCYCNRHTGPKLSATRKYTMRTIIKHSTSSLVAAVLTITATSASAELNIAQQPLFLGKSAEPNIMFILDDSGSMLWSYLPDAIDKTSGNRRQSHLYNHQYYNPEVSYRPPPTGGGT